MVTPPDELLDEVRAVMSQSLLGIASALSDLLRPMVGHDALVIFTEDCTGRPQKKAGDPRITENVSIAELDVLRADAAGMREPARFADAAIAGGAHAVAVWTADTAAILVLVGVAEAEIADGTAARIARVWQLVALSIRQQVATASPSYLADSRSASRERASLIADLTDAHATTLESLLVVLRSSQHGDAGARQRAVDIAAEAMVALRAVSDRDRRLSEEPVHSAFERLRHDLAPLVRHGGLDVEFVPPPVGGRPLPGEVAHAARAIVRGAVLTLGNADRVDRVRIQWDCDGSNLLVDIRDNGAGDLGSETPGLDQLAARVSVLDGSFGVSATPGWGSQLHIELPLDPAPPALNVPDDNRLTPREREVLALLAEGARNRAIGTALTISENTVKFHVANLLHKTGTTSRSQLVALVAGNAG